MSDKCKFCGVDNNGDIPEEIYIGVCSLCAQYGYNSNIHPNHDRRETVDEIACRLFNKGFENIDLNDE